MLHFDEPHIYDYPGWPYVIPVVSTPADNGDANAATDGYAAGQVVMTKQPSLSAQSSATLLPGFAPQQPLFRKQQLVTDAAGKLHVPSPLPGAQILPDQSRDSSMSSLDQGSHRNLHEGTQRDSQSRVDLLALDGDDEVTLDSDDDDNVEIVGHMELDGENASNVDAIARLSRSLKDGAALTDRSDVGQAISRPSTTTPRPIGLDSDEPSELFASIDPKTIESVSKMGTRTSASTTTSSGSMTSMGASATTGGGSATAAMPLISQQSMRVVPGMIAAASRQRTKSAEDTSIQATTSADASAASVLRKEKKKLHMTQM